MTARLIAMIAGCPSMISIVLVSTNKASTPWTTSTLPPTHKSAIQNAATQKKKMPIPSHTKCAGPNGSNVSGITRNNADGG